MSTQNWQPPRGPGLRATREAREAADAEKAKPRDFVAEAKAAINAADQKESIIAAVIVAQALDRFGKQVETAAAINTYKRA